jgi:Ca2+-binding EF-hand superfamily protein
MHDFDQLIEQFKPKAALAINEFRDFVEKNFDAFDLDGDGFLSRSELEAALAQKDRTAKEAGFLSFLLIRLAEIALSHEEEWGSKPDCISK